MPAPTAAAVSQFVSSRGDMGPKYDLTLLPNKIVVGGVPVGSLPLIGVGR